MAFTGIDIARAEQDIDNFHNSAVNACDKCGGAFNELMYDLWLYWASPNAYAYTKDKSDQLYSTYLNAREVVDHIVSGACKAADILAQSNGCRFYYDYEPFVHNPDYGYYYCEESSNGAIGMDVEGVKFALAEFDGNVANAMKLLDSVPSGISFYDADGTLINTYNRNINDFKTKFTELVDGLKKDIKQYMETEQNNILVAKQNAEETMKA